MDITTTPIQSYTEWTTVFATTLAQMLEFLVVTEKAIEESNIVLPEGSFLETVRGLWNGHPFTGRQQGVVLALMILSVEKVPYSEEIMGNLARLRNYQVATSSKSPTFRDDLN